MVKQNQGWERRAEITEIRRSETKLRKQKTADKRQQKSMAQELLSMIDRHAQRPLNIHVWTDCIPTDSIPLLDAVRFEQSDKRRARAESMHDYDDAAARGSNLLTGLRGTLISGKGRVRSNSVNDSNRPNLASVDEERPSQPMFLCKAHFFTGKCLDVKGKKGGCRYNHYFAPYKTLCDVLKARKTQTSERALQQSAENAAYAGTASGDAAMEMIHYMHIQVDSGDDDTFISDAITNQLTAHGVKPASVVYAVVNNKLIYDRNQGGLLINDIGLKTDNGGRLSRDDTTLPNETLLSFPGSILEYTLTFLPDSAVAVATQVCKAWHQEIGQSPNLWRLMLERRNWPLPSIKSQSLLAVPDVPSRDLFREAFIEHYTAMRDMRAIQSAIYALDSRKSQTEKEMCYQDFSARKYAPTASNLCVGVQIWSPNQMLVAYSVDCSIRLFECAARDNDERLCRELVCHSVDPYKSTRRRNCVLVSMDLDQDFIGCLCQVNADKVDTEAWVMIIVSRDEFLQGQSSVGLNTFGSSCDGQQVKIIDVGEAVLNYLLSSDVVDHRLLQLIDFLVAGGQVGEIEVLVSHTLAACGDGRFLVEVSISIPAHGEDDIDAAMLLIDRKLVLFSASVGAIVWIGESNDVTKGMRPRHENMSLNYTRQRVSGKSRQYCHVVVASPVSAALLLGSIEPTGNVRSTHPIDGCDIARQQTLLDDWQLVLRSERLVVVAAQSVIAADVFCRTNGNEPTKYKSIITVYSVNFGLEREDGDSYRTIDVDGNIEIVRLTNYKDQHIFALCRVHHHSLVQAGEEPLPEHMSLCAVCIDIISGRELGRSHLLNDIGQELSEIPILSVGHNTIGVGFSCRGVIMTGNDVRSVEKSRRIIVLSEADRSTRKKKKKAVPKNHKKDGFARGMSMRG